MPSNVFPFFHSATIFFQIQSFEQQIEESFTLQTLKSKLLRFGKQYVEHITDKYERRPRKRGT